jgi:hypothetical protein
MAPVSPWEDPRGPLGSSGAGRGNVVNETSTNPACYSGTVNGFFINMAIGDGRTAWGEP